MVYGFAQQSGGFVTVTSREGAGTTFFLYIPLAQSESVEEPRVDKGATVTSGDGQSILVVEDDDSVRLLLDSALRDIGYHVHLAGDAQQALGLLSRIERLDLLITDVGLPGLNGRQLAEIAQQQRPELPVLFIAVTPKTPRFARSFLAPE